METNIKNIVQSKESHLHKLIRIRRVIELTGISKSYIYQLCDKGLFPQSIQLVAGGSSVAWVEQEVLDWIKSRIQARTQSKSEAA